MVLLRVGIDTGCYCGIYSPLFKDGKFEYIPIPNPVNDDSRTYGNHPGRYCKSLVEYFPEKYQPKMKDKSIHFDPEFATYTYGDPTTPKQSLRRLQNGDILAFYCGLQRYPPGDFQSDPALYLMGRFEVRLAGHASDLGKEEVRKDFGENFHVLHPGNRINRLVLVKGGEGSKLLTKATKISSVGKDRKGRDIFVLSEEMEKYFGKFTKLNAIQRSTPRWVKPPFVLRAAEFIRSLE